MAKKKTVNWYGRDVELVVRKATQEAIEAIAFRIEARAKANIIANNQVDTGFMLNSGYVVLPGRDTHAEAEAEARARNPGAVMAPAVPLPGRRGAIVAWGASYTIYQEMRRTFLYKAVEDTAGEVAHSEIRSVARRRRLTR